MNRRMVFRGAICALLASISGCNVREMAQRATPPPADSMARATILHAAHGTLASLDSALDTTMRTPAMRAELQHARTMLQPYSLGDPELVGHLMEKELGDEYHTLTYQVPLNRTVGAWMENRGRPFHWMSAQVTVRNNNGAYSVFAFNANLSELSLTEANGFRHNLRFPQLLWLLLTAFAFGTVVYAVVQVLRAPLERKWPWVIVSLLGVARGTMNWTTGAFTIEPLSIQVFAVGFIRPGWYAPMFIMWAFPAGAFWALEVVRRARRRAAFLAMLERGRAGEVPGSRSPEDAPR